MPTPRLSLQDLAEQILANPDPRQTGPDARSELQGFRDALRHTAATFLLNRVGELAGMVRAWNALGFAPNTQRVFVRADVRISIQTDDASGLLLIAMRDPAYDDRDGVAIALKGRGPLSEGAFGVDDLLEIAVHTLPEVPPSDNPLDRAAGLEIAERATALLRHPGLFRATTTGAAFTLKLTPVAAMSPDTNIAPETRARFDRESAIRDHAIFTGDFTAIEAVGLMAAYIAPDMAGAAGTS